MSSDKTGVRAAIKAEVQTASEAIRERTEAQILAFRAGHGAQASLLPALLEGADEAADAGGLEFIDQETEQAGGGRGIGRPKGARNKRTQHTLEYLQSLGYGDPLRGLAEIWSRPIAVLAAELGCTKLEAFDRQQDAMKIALPFWHQKLPQAVVIDPAAAMTLVTIHAEEMFDLLSRQDDEISKRGIELLGPLLELTATAAADDEGESE